ncbi:merlin-like [Centruroides sculpturatus]|uniref:merlin-like n=1 Tax=Centruroides sculpturatus TaxID=218467 RepID=UPI000C6D0126|nr:merlin-like [Centruroides sculpturatus]
MPFKRAKKSGKVIHVRVSTMDADLEFDLDFKATGRELFDLICRTIGLREVWYFGLQYIDSKGFVAWLKLDKKVQDQDIPKKSPLPVLLLAKFFPEDVAEELVQEITQHLFFLQIKQSILNMDIYCAPEASVLLASYAVQAKRYHSSWNVAQGRLVVSAASPEVVHRLTLRANYRSTENVDYLVRDRKDEAEMEYLKIAQDLDMYGVNYFPIHNKKDSELWLGVTALGLNIYEKNNKLAPKINFPWSEIRNISFDDKKLNKFIIINSSIKIYYQYTYFYLKIQILDLCIGNHDLFMRRRKPDSMEVQQMKAQAKEEKLRRQVERNKLAREKQLREEVQREKAELEQRLMQYQEEARLAQEALRRSEETAELLAEKSRFAEEEAMLLKQKAAEAEAEIQRIKISAIKTEEEKIMMERKAQEAELLATQMVEESERRSIMINAFLAIHEYFTSLERRQNAEIKHTFANNAISPDVLDHLPRQIGDLRLDGDLGLGCDTVTCDLIMDGHMEQLSLEIEKERVEYLEKSKHLQEQLRELKSEIEVLKVEENLTPMDRIYEENVIRGESKYSTLRKTKSGSTKARVAFFEEL